MAGLDLAKKIVDPAGYQKLREEVARRREEKAARAAAGAGAGGQTDKLAGAEAAAPTRRSRAIEELPPGELPQAPDFERHILKGISIEEPWRFINPLMLYGRHLGIPGGLARKLDRLHAATAAGDAAGARRLRDEITTIDARALLPPAKAEARAATNFFRGVKRLEDAVSLFGRDPRPGIRNRKEGKAVFAGKLDLHQALGQDLHGVVSVAHEVEQDLRDFRGSAEHWHLSRRELYRQLDV